MSKLNTEKQINEYLKNIALQHFDNKELIRKINDIFSMKGLDKKRVKGVFGQTIEVSSLELIEKIAFAVGAFEVLKIKEIDPNVLFSKKQMANFKIATPPKEEIITTMRFDNVIKCDEFSYLTRITYKQLYEYYKNVLLLYNFDSQREAKLTKIGKKGGYVREINLDVGQKNEIKTLMKNHEYEENEIIINVRIIEGCNPDFHFNPIYNENLGTVTITPHYDIEDENFTVAEIADGFHRCKAGMEGYEEELKKGKELEGGLDLRIVLRDLEHAQKITSQSFKRSDTGAEHLKSYEKDNYTIFVDEMIKASSILNNNVSLNYQDYMVNETITYKTILVDGLKSTNIDVEKISVRAKKSKEIANNIDNLINYLKEVYFDNNLEEIKESVFLTANIFCGYVYACSLVDNVLDIAEKIYTGLNDTEKIKSLKLNNKECKTKKIIEFFKSEIMGEN